jgi:methyl-accepting chemotaxis protein
VRRSIAVKISVYVGVLVLVISAGIGIFASYRSMSAVTKQVEAALIMQAEEAAEILENRFQIQLTALETIAARPEIASMNWALQEPILKSENERLGLYQAIGVVDRSGFARYTDGSSMNIADRDHVIRSLRGESVVSDVLVGRADGSLVIMYAVPITNNGQVVGALLGRRDGWALNDITDRLGFGEMGWSLVLDSDGRIMAHPIRDYVIEQRNVLTDTDNLADAGRAIAALGMGNTGVVRYELDGTQRIVAYTPVPATDWMIGVGAMESDVLADVTSLRNYFIGLTAIFLVLGVTIGILVARQVAKPLQQVQAVIEAVADGDLTRRVEINSKDEIGAVANALNRTMDSMTEVLGLASTSQEASASVQEVASTANQFSSTLDLMNSNAQAMNETVQGVSRQADEGTRAIADIIEKMRGLQENTQRMAEQVSSLGSLSDQIGLIANTISSIAEQTNLLALNAAIEAARAGEHGRGFAVVAGEVRELAEQSAKATTDIESLIRQIQSGISTTVQGISEGSAQAENALSSVNQSSKVLNEILAAIEEIDYQVNELSASLAEINLGGQEIASTSEEQAASVQQVAAAAQDLMNLGTRLSEIIQHFKLEG